MLEHDGTGGDGTGGALPKTGGAPSTGGRVIPSGGRPSATTGGASGAGGGPTGGPPQSTVLMASSFDQLCKTDGDCMLVVDGEQCGCTCKTGSMARTALLSFIGALSHVVCPPRPLCDTSLCPPVGAACISGKCSTRGPKYVRATDYDQTCEEDIDCQLIRERLLCSTTGECSYGTVNKAGYAQYSRDIDLENCEELAYCTPPRVSQLHCVKRDDAGTGVCAIAED